MNISTVSNAHLTAAHVTQRSQQAAAATTARSHTVAPTDADGDHDGTAAGGRIDVRA